MSVRIVRDTIVETLSEITDIGIVEGRQGRKESLPWTNMQSATVLPLWTVTCVQSRWTEPKTIGGKFYEHTFRIRGFYPHNFDADSDTTWTDYIDKVRDKLDVQPAIAICSMTDPPSLVQNDFVLYGDVLCHFCLFDFRVEEWEVG